MMYIKKFSVKWLITPFLLTVLCTALFASGTYAASKTVTVSFTVNQSYSSSFSLLELINKERAKKNRDPLVMDKKLMSAAMQRAAELIIYQNRTRPNGQDGLSIQSTLAYGENYACGYNTPAAILKAWKRSPSHKANLLRKNYQSAGIGIVTYEDQTVCVIQYGLNVAKKAKAASYKDKRALAKVVVDTKSDAYYPNFDISDTQLRVGESADLEFSWGAGFFSFPLSNLKIKNLTPKILSVSGSTVRARKKGTGKIRIYIKGYKAGAKILKIKVR